MLKNWCFQIVVLEKTLESPSDSKEVKPVNPKGNQPWMFIGRTDAKTEVLIIWLPDVKSWLTGKDPDARKDWRQEKRATEDEMVRWDGWMASPMPSLNGHEFEQAPGVGDGQGHPAFCSPWGSQRVRHTKQLNNSNLTVISSIWGSSSWRTWSASYLLFPILFQPLCKIWISVKTGKFMQSEEWPGPKLWCSRQSLSWKLTFYFYATVHDQQWQIIEYFIISAWTF